MSFCVIYCASYFAVVYVGVGLDVLLISDYYISKSTFINKLFQDSDELRNLACGYESHEHFVAEIHRPET